MSASKPAASPRPAMAAASLPSATNAPTIDLATNTTAATAASTSPRITVTIHALRNIAKLLPLAAAAPVPTLTSPSSRISTAATGKKKGKEEAALPDLTAPLTYVLSFPTFASLAPPTPPATLPTALAASPPVFSPLLTVDASTPATSLPVSFTHSEPITSVPVLLDAIHSASFTLTLHAYSATAAQPDKKTADKKKSTAKETKDEFATTAPTYPAESLNVVGTVSVPVQHLLSGGSEVSGVYVLKAVAEAGEAVEVEVTVAVSEPLLTADEAANTNTLTLQLHSYHNLPLGFLDDVQPAAPAATSRPPTASGGKGAAKGKEAAAALDDIFTLLYRVPLSTDTTATVWSETATLRQPTEAEKASGQPPVIGRWNDAPAKVTEEPTSAPVPATPAAATKDKRAELQSARGKSPRPDTATGAKKAGEKKDAVAEAVAAVVAPPAVSNAVLSFEFARTTLLTPTAITAFQSSIASNALFPVQLTCSRLASATATEPQLSIVGLSLLDLSSLLLPGRTRVEGYFAVTQTSAAAAKGGADDKKGKAKTGADKGAKKKDEAGGGAAGGGSDTIDTFDACHTYVHLSLELAKPLLPTPPPLPLSELVPASALPPSPSPLSELDCLFPPDLSFLYTDASSTARHTFRQQVRRLVEQMRAAGGGSGWEDGWRRRLEATLYRLVQSRFTLNLNVIRGREEEDRTRQQMCNEAYSELMDEVSAVLAESDGNEQMEADSKALQVENGVHLWSQLAQQAEEMEDYVLAAYHHASCLQATRAYHRQYHSDVSRQLRLTALYGHATFFCRRGQWESAELALHDVLAEEDAHLPSQLLLACMLLEQGRLQEAHDLLQPLLVLSLANHPLVQAVLALLYHHEEEDEKKEDVVSHANATLRSMPTSVDDADPLVHVALSSAPASQCGWAWLHSGDVCVLGARYGAAMGLGRSVAVWLSGVLRAEELREAKEEKEMEAPQQPDDERLERVDEEASNDGPLSPTSASHRLLVKHAALLQYAPLLSSQQQDTLALRCASRIVASLDIATPASTALPSAVRMYFLSRLAAIYHACKRVEECEPLLLAYISLLPRYAHLPLHQPSIALLTRLLLTKQKRAQALSLLAPLIAHLRANTGDGASQPPTHWLLLTWLDGLYADGRWSECVDVAAEVSRVEPVNSRWCAVLCCVETRQWKEKEEERDKRREQEEASHRRTQRRQPASAASTPAAFQPSLELQSLTATAASLESSALAYCVHFQQLTAQLPLPNCQSSLSLLLELGHRMYDRQRLDEAEQCWQAAAAMDDAMSGAGGGVARERLEWIKARKAGSAVEGESEARLIQGLFRRAQRKKEGREREHKEVIVVHKSAGNRSNRQSAAADGGTRRIQSLD